MRTWIVSAVFVLSLFFFLPGVAHGQQCGALNSIFNSLKQLDDCVKSRCPRMDSLYRRVQSQMAQAEKDKQCDRNEVRRARDQAARLMGIVEGQHAKERAAVGPILTPHEMQEYKMVEKVHEALMERIQKTEHIGRVFTRAVQKSPHANLLQVVNGWIHIANLDPIRQECRKKLQPENAKRVANCRAMKGIGRITCDGVNNLDTTCQQLETIRETYKEFMRVSVTAFINNEPVNARKIIKGFQKEGYIHIKELHYMMNLEKSLKSFRYWVERVYKTMGEKPPDGFDGTMVELKAQFDKLFSTFSNTPHKPFGSRKRTLEKAHRNLLQNQIDKTSGGRKATIRRADYDVDNWFISRNDLGIIQHRAKRIRLTYQIQGESFCRSNVSGVIEQYQGGGKYVSPGRVSWSQWDADRF